MEYALTFV